MQSGCKYLGRLICENGLFACSEIRPAIFWHLSIEGVPGYTVRRLKTSCVTAECLSRDSFPARAPRTAKKCAIVFAKPAFITGLLLLLMLKLPCFLIVAVYACITNAAEPTITLERVDAQSLYLQKPLGVIEVAGSDSIHLIPSMPLGREAWVLEMECFCVGGIKEVTATPGLPFTKRDAKVLPAIAHSEVFIPYMARLDSTNDAWPEQWKELRLDLKMAPDASLQVRNVRLRLQQPGDLIARQAGTNAAADPIALEAYLNQDFVAQISNIKVDATKITISGNVSGNQSHLFIGDIPMATLLGSAKSYQSLEPIVTDANGAFIITLPRRAMRDNREQDRLTDRWQLFRREADFNEMVAVSHARYADEVACRSPHLAPAKVTSKKGLGGWSFNREALLHDELETLGIAAVTVNVAGLHDLVSTTPQAGSTPITYQGKTYHVNEQRLARYDQTFREAEKHGAMVSAILLLSNPAKADSPDVKLLGHPDAVKDGVFAMPNVTSPQGIEYYGAILDTLAERWSRDDGVHGRVHHWIIHNEVDFGWVWTNAGEKTDIAYMDLYQRSMRLSHLISRQYDPGAKAFISLTHYWGDRGNNYGYGSKRMLELLTSFCEAEGNFDWGLAYHPYPQNLFNPRTWEDTQATFDFATPKITPQNIEVLDAFMKLPAMRYRGEVRTVHLSENGFNSKDYSPKSLEDQAAGMALAWKKIAKLSSIESWQYHNWIDNRHEGDLRIGLRRFPDDEEAPLGEKPIWNLYKALGTPQEDEVAAPYLKPIGIQSWDEVVRSGEIK